MGLMTPLWSSCFVAAVACLAGVAAAQADPPQMLHIAFRGSGADVVVSWATNLNTATSTVRYGTSASALTSVATGSGHSYYQLFNHDVVLVGLAPATVYYYSCGNAAAGWSKVYSFESPRAAGDATPFSVAVYGDMGATESEETIASLVARLPSFDFVMHIGDFGYSDDNLNTSNFEPIWNEWQGMIEPIAASKAYMVAPGNHEASCHEFGDILCPLPFTNFTAYNYRFRMPAVESGSGTNMWSSFDYGMAHFIMIDTETDVPKAPEGPDTLWHAGVGVRARVRSGLSAGQTVRVLAR